MRTVARCPTSMLITASSMPLMTWPQSVWNSMGPSASLLSKTVPSSR